MPLTNGQIPVLANVPNSGVAQLSGTTIGALGANTNGVTVYTSGSLGGRVYSLMGYTNDTVTGNVWVYILRGATIIPVGLVNIPVSAGNTNAARFNTDFLDGINILGLPLDNTGKRYIPLQGGDVLRCSTLANPTATRSFWITAHGADYQA
jgi:hypothetical protein